MPLAWPASSRYRANMVDPEPRRAKILEAAVREFADHGFAGARVEAIARRAGCNKQLLYHYFGSKEGLHASVVVATLSDRTPVAVGSPEELLEAVGHVFDDFAEHETWWRLMSWEALELGDGPLVAEDERRRTVAENVEALEAAQRAGVVDPALPPRLLLLAITGILLVPFLLPQLVRLWIGTNPSDPTFKRDYRAFVITALARLTRAEPP
jgi:AcrR family transcriptional regulator